MSNEWYMDRFADSIEDEKTIEEYTKQFQEECKKILKSEEQL